MVCFRKRMVFGNDLVRIPWPEQTTQVRDVMLKLGMQKTSGQCNHIIKPGSRKSLRCGYRCVYTNCKTMTVTDALQNYYGRQWSGHCVSKENHHADSYRKFRPIISIFRASECCKYWSDATSIYNKVPFVSACKH